MSQQRPLCPSARRLRTLFDVTEAEARLAVSLAGGEPLRRAAAELGIAYGTARSRPTQVFESTGTRSRSELLRALLAVPACQ